MEKKFIIISGLCTFFVLLLMGVCLMPEKKAKLTNYKTKRDFTITPEPEGKKVKKSSKNPIFVIHKHDASHLHYDLRLEIDDVLKSWAVPKGPSTNPSDKHLAIETEDHPMEYADFEGTIPEGQYGGGTVMVWDYGTYTNLRTSKNMQESYQDGKIEVELDGKKLHGGYVLVQTAMRGDERNWLLKKIDDETADARKNIVNSEPKSAKTGRTMKEIAKEES